MRVLRDKRHAPRSDSEGSWYDSFVARFLFASLRRRPEGRPVLAAWKTDGTPLWTAEHPEAYQLAVTREHVASDNAVVILRRK